MNTAPRFVYSHVAMASVDCLLITRRPLSLLLSLPNVVQIAIESRKKLGILLLEAVPYEPHQQLRVAPGMKNLRGLILVQESQNAGLDFTMECLHYSDVKLPLESFRWLLLLHNCRVLGASIVRLGTAVLVVTV